MKALYKILLIIFILALALLWAQSVRTTRVGDISEIRTRVHMMGLQFTVTSGGAGISNTVDSAMTFTTIVDTLASNGTIVEPCDFIHRVFWVENTGGTTIKLDVWNMTVGTIWTRDSTITTDCTAFLAANKFTFLYSFVASDGDSTTPASMSWLQMPSAIGATSEWTGLWAEDPASVGDSLWRNQRDQVEFHIGILCPYSSTTGTVQNFKVAITARIGN